MRVDVEDQDDLQDFRLSDARTKRRRKQTKDQARDVSQRFLGQVVDHGLVREQVQERFQPGLVSSEE